MDDEPANPYAPPTSDLSIKPAAGGLSPRAAMLKHEVSLQSVAMVFNITAVLLLCGGILALRHGVLPQAAAYGAMVLGGVAFTVESGLRRFLGWARVAGLVFSVAVVFAFPLLLLVALYVIPTLVNRHSRAICSKDYRELITATPHLSIATTGTPRYLVMILGAVFTAILWRGSPLF